MVNLDERLNDSDLEQIISYEGVEKKDVKRVLACLFGENDGPSWHYILEMKDGTYTYLTGWCDYTGWGCQDGSKSIKNKSLEELIPQIADDDFGHKNLREQLKNQINGKQPYGLQI